MLAGRRAATGGPLRSRASGQAGLPRLAGLRAAPQTTRSLGNERRPYLGVSNEQEGNGQAAQTDAALGADTRGCDGLSAGTRAAAAAGHVSPGHRHSPHVPGLPLRPTLTDTHNALLTRRRPSRKRSRQGPRGSRTSRLAGSLTLAQARPLPCSGERTVSSP